MHYVWCRSERRDRVGDESTELTRFLDHQRATMLTTIDDQMNTTTAARDLTLADYSNVAVVEDGWFRRVLLGEPPATRYRDFVDPDWDFGPRSTTTLATYSLYEHSCDRSRRAVAEQRTAVITGFRTGEPTGSPGTPCDTRSHIASECTVWRSTPSRVCSCWPVFRGLSPL